MAEIIRSVFSHPLPVRKTLFLSSIFPPAISFSVIFTTMSDSPPSFLHSAFFGHSAQNPLMTSLHIDESLSLSGFLNFSDRLLIAKEREESIFARSPVLISRSSSLFFINISRIFPFSSRFSRLEYDSGSRSNIAAVVTITAAIIISGKKSTR